MKQWISIPAGKANWLELASEAHRFVKPTADRAHEAFGELLQKEERQKSRMPRRAKDVQSRRPRSN
jgi:hypothetical protein